MKKWLLLLLGLLFILLLTIICFSFKQETIRQELISKSKSVLAHYNGSIDVDILGNDINTTRIIKLDGEVKSNQEKIKAQKLVESVNGVYRVENNLKVIASKESIKTPKVKSEKEVIPYVISVIKDSNKRILLRGYVPDKKVHQEIIQDATRLFAQDTIIDKLEIKEGAPKEWVESIKLGLKELNATEYGKFSIVDNNFTFSGHVSSKSIKGDILNEFNRLLNSNLQKNINIEAPSLKIVDIVSSKSKDIKSLSNKNIQTDQNSSIENNLAKETKEAIVNCKTQIDDLLSKSKIHFSYNRSKIKKDSYKLLNTLVDIIKQCPKVNITIEGHTDSIGSARYNKILSQKRALAVKQYLIHKGIAKERLKAIGYGESRPIASNATKSGRKKNRRIEFKFEGVKE